MTTSGYSGKPLAQKLGFKLGLRAMSVHAPLAYPRLLESEIRNSDEVPTSPHDFLHAFYDSKASLLADAEALRNALAPGGALWISWPKKTSGHPTDVGEQDLRDILLPLGIVDTKICAVDETWSALKFMHRTKK